MAVKQDREKRRSLCNKLMAESISWNLVFRYLSEVTDKLFPCNLARFIVHRTLYRLGYGNELRILRTTQYTSKTLENRAIDNILDAYPQYRDIVMGNLMYQISRSSPIKLYLGSIVSRLTAIDLIRFVLGWN